MDERIHKAEALGGKSVGAKTTTGLRTMPLEIFVFGCANYPLAGQTELHICQPSSVCCNITSSLLEQASSIR